MATSATPGTAASSLPAAGGTSTAGLSEWAAPYITDYLGKAQALSNMPYQTYQGPLTAGASGIQNKVFQGIGNLTFPGNLGQSFSNTGAPTIGADGQPVGGGGLAQSYMNPYLQQALDPQLRELQRQSDIQRVQDAGRLTQAGAFGGGRQAIMESEGRRNLLGKQADVLGTGYATAYDKAMQQFNAEQGQGRDLTRLMADIGGVQRGIESEGIAADLGEFNAQRDFPYKQLQFQRDMITGLPTGSVTNSPAQLSGIAQLISAAGGIDKLLKSTGQSDLGDLLKRFGLNFGGTGELV
jgi:hypothetical protein